MVIKLTTSNLNVFNAANLQRLQDEHIKFTVLATGTFRDRVKAHLTNFFQVFWDVCRGKTTDAPFIWSNKKIVAFLNEEVQAINVLKKEREVPDFQTIAWSVNNAFQVCLAKKGEFDQLDVTAFQETCEVVLPVIPARGQLESGPRDISPPAPSEEPKWAEWTESAENPEATFSWIMREFPDGFNKENLSFINHHISSLTLKNLTFPAIYRPNIAALEQVTCDYYKEYGILTRIATTEKGSEKNISHILKELEATIQGPQYAAIVVQHADGSTIPVICFYGKKEKGQRIQQFFIVDSEQAAPDSLYALVNSELEKIPESEILFYTGLLKKQDSSFNWIDSMERVKIILLTMKDQPGKEGLKKYLEKFIGDMPIESGKPQKLFFSNFPPAFRYKGEMTPLETVGKFSSRELKGQSRDLKGHEDSTDIESNEKVQIEFQVQFIGSWPMEIPEPRLPDITQFTKSDGRFLIKGKIRVSMYTHLLREAEKQRKISEKQA